MFSINPLVSVIISIRNVADVIVPCLTSLLDQTYSNIEIIVVDNHSTDNSKEIVTKQFPSVRWLESNGERCKQRNEASEIAKGDYLMFLDADMRLESQVIRECVDSQHQVVIISEVTIGQGFWSKVRAFERSFYHGDSGMEAARFMRTSLFKDIKGYDETLFAAGEDWDLHRRLIKTADSYMIHSLIYHDEGKVLLREYLKKKGYYAKYLAAYRKKWGNETVNQLGWKRVTIYLKQPKKIIMHPILFLSMIFMLGFAYIVFKQAENSNSGSMI